MLKYLQTYDKQLQLQVQQLIDNHKLKAYILSKYPMIHGYSSDKALYRYVMELKNSTMKGSSPIAKVLYDTKIRDINAALGTHTYVSRVQGGKLKAKHEIRIAHIFKQMPEPFLKMIVTHELTHLKVKEHNKAFYKLCRHIEPAYHQLEFDVRIYLTYREMFGNLWQKSPTDKL
jgi:hypothetical protein